MSRPAESSDFFVEVDGIGTFSFAKRMMRDEMRCAAEFSRLTEGVETPTAWLGIVAGWISELKVLTVTTPPGWDLDSMDPLDDESYAKMGKVHGAFRDKERSFRKDAGKGSEAKRTGVGQGHGVLVSQEVQPGADGPAVP